MRGGMVLDYDTNASYFGTSFTLASTVIPYVLGRCEFWLFMALHLAITFSYRAGYLVGADESKTTLFIDWNDMKVISAITTFFEVFFTNQTFTRYLHLYDRTRNLLKCVCEFCFETSLHLKSTSQSHIRLATRYFLCSVVLFFSQMKKSEDEKLWAELQRLSLIRPDEQEHLETYDRDMRSLVVLHWAAKVIKLGHKNSAGKAPGNALKNMIDKLVVTHGIQQEVIDTMSLPIPFQYFHLLNLMIVINLLLWAYGMGISESAFAPFVYFFAALIFMGMMELAVQLSDPFGDDETDFPLDRWLREVLEDARTLLESEQPGEDDAFKSLIKGEERLRVSPDMEQRLQAMMSPGFGDRELTTCSTFQHSDDDSSE